VSIGFSLLAALARTGLLYGSNEVGLYWLWLEEVVVRTISGYHVLEATGVERHVVLVHEGGKQATVVHGFILLELGQLELLFLGEDWEFEVRV